MLLWTESIAGFLEAWSFSCLKDGSRVLESLDGLRTCISWIMVFTSGGDVLFSRITKCGDIFWGDAIGFRFRSSIQCFSPFLSLWAILWVVVVGRTLLSKNSGGWNTMSLGKITGYVYKVLFTMEAKFGRPRVKWLYMSVLKFLVIDYVSLIDKLNRCFLSTISGERIQPAFWSCIFW